MAHAATAAANTAMSEHAETWARELIESTRDPRGPARDVFPTLARPATVSSEDADTLFPLSRPEFHLSDTDDDDDNGHQSPEEL